MAQIVGLCAIVLRCYVKYRHRECHTVVSSAVKPSECQTVMSSAVKPSECQTVMSSAVKLSECQTAMSNAVTGVKSTSMLQSKSL